MDPNAIIRAKCQLNVIITKIIDKNTFARGKSNFCPNSVVDI